jgi:hypothetical protein
VDTVFLPAVSDYKAFMSFTIEMKSIRHLALGGAFQFVLSMIPAYGDKLGRLKYLESLIIQTGLTFGQMTKF